MSMRRVLGLAGALVLAVAAATVPASTVFAQPLPGSYTLAVYGDAPYGTTPTDTAEFNATPAFIDSINADPSVGLVVHVGDIHSGKQFCTESYDQSIATLWSAYRKPLVYTPGDNEWTDCHKAGEGGGTYDATTGTVKHVIDPATGQPVDYAGGDPLANLNLVRSLFFAKPGHTLGQDSLVLSQSQVPSFAHPTDRQYVENVLFLRAGVLFVAVNLPGGSNNDADPWFGAPVTDAQTTEAANRTGADLRWLDLAFSLAKLLHTRGVAVIEQADMWDLDGKTVAHIANYEPFVGAVASGAQSFGGPVLLFNGDSHVYRSDNPLQPGAACVTEGPGGTEVACTPEDANHPGYNVANVHRITVHGSTFPLEWLKLTISTGPDPSGPNTFGPFSWARMIQS
jgi:hypothetical protein